MNDSNSKYSIAGVCIVRISYGRLMFLSAVLFYIKLIAMVIIRLSYGISP